MRVLPVGLNIWLASAWLTGQEPASGPASVARLFGTALIVGQVVDGTTGRPVGNSSVILSNSHSSTADLALGEFDRARLATPPMTDSEGRASVRDAVSTAFTDRTGAHDGSAQIVRSD